ncbi:MAG: hypothetical protein ABEJ64_03290 [Candidatus Nanohaloarchaea archaeon]
MDVFGKPSIEVVADLADPTPVYVSGQQDTGFYREITRDADLVIFRNSEEFSQEIEDILDGGYRELLQRSEQDVYVHEDAPRDFPGMNPYVVEGLAAGGVEELAEAYLEQGHE